MAQPNILLIVLDSVRAQNVGHLDYPRNTTPSIDELCEKSTSYIHARSPGIHSISSHVSMFTGYHVSEHRATSHSATLRPGHTIWEYLAEEGYRTGLFTPNAIVAESSNLASFFQTVEGPKRDVLVFPEALGPEEVPGMPSYTSYLWACLKSGSPIKSIVNGLAREFGESSAAHNPKQEHGEVYVQDFLDWVKSDSDTWAACINLMDAHYPYIPLEEFDHWGSKTLQNLHREAMGGPLTTQYLSKRPLWELQACESLYDDCIRQADAYVGQTLEKLEEMGELENTLIVVTSDHGEGFGEYSVLNDDVQLIDHSWGIGDEVSHVPLVVKYPGDSTQRIVRAPASLTKFPSVVKGVISGEKEGFVPSDRTVITSSYRVGEPGNNLPIPEVEREPYFGPWHAICREESGGIVIDAVRRKDEVRYWLSLPEKEVLLEPDREFVKTLISGLNSKDVTGEDRDVDTEVQERLKTLGYVS